MQENSKPELLIPVTETFGGFTVLPKPLACRTSEGNRDVVTQKSHTTFQPQLSDCPDFAASCQTHVLTQHANNALS